MTRDWRPARCLVALLSEINDAFPNRDVDEDGVIGDPDHAARISDHNPNVHDVVTAWDCTAQSWTTDFVNALVESDDPRLKYIIWNRKIWARDRSAEGWRDYDGRDPHTGHAHISFSAWPSQYDRTDPWNVFPRDDGDMTPQEKTLLQETHAMLAKLTAPRRPDKKDADPTHLSLADIYTKLEQVEAKLNA